MSINTYLNILLSEADDEPKKKAKEEDTTDEPSMDDDMSLDEPTVDDTEDTTTDDTTDEPPADDTTDDPSMDEPPTDDTGDEPSMDDTGDTGTDETMDEENPDDTASTGNTDKLKSIQLAQSYKQLYTTINGIIDKIYEIEKKSEEESIIIEKVLGDLYKIKNILFDYIDKCFSNNTYEKNLFNLYYFENSIKITTQMIQKIKELRQKN